MSKKQQIEARIVAAVAAERERWETALRAQDPEIAQMAADAARWRWARPILSGDDTDEAQSRAFRLGMAFVNGEQDVDAAVDALMREDDDQ